MRNFLALIAAASIGLSACQSSAPSPARQTLAPSALPLTTPTPFVDGTASTPAATLRLWLAPEFGPSRDSPSGLLMSERLTAFQNAHPGVTLVVRLKARTGPAGLLELLVAAHEAAPDRLPDVISLNNDGLHTAAVKVSSSHWMV